MYVLRYGRFCYFAVMQHKKLHINIKRPEEAREAVLKVAKEKDWWKLMEIFKENEVWKFITDDAFLKKFIEDHFIGELLSGKSLENDPKAYKHYLQLFYAIHLHKQYSFALDPEQFKSLVLKIVEVEDDPIKAADYAITFPYEEVCKMAIERRDKVMSKFVRHSQEGELVVTENKNVGGADHSINLFKSQQEIHFYKAALQYFNGKLVVPNVALSAVISYNKIQSQLTPDEKSFFFKGLLDCVVFDILNDYKPVKFIELDSPYHDAEHRKAKDALKDSILAKAGQRLIRIRRINTQPNERDFLLLLAEAIGNFN